METPSRWTELLAVFERQPITYHHKKVALYMFNGRTQQHFIEKIGDTIYFEILEKNYQGNMLNFSPNRSIGATLESIQLPASEQEIKDCQSSLASLENVPDVASFVYSETEARYTSFNSSTCSTDLLPCPSITIQSLTLLPG